MKKQCECCLSSNNLSEITEKHCQKILSCFSIEISISCTLDESSNYICNSCAEKVDESIAFRCQILTSQTALKELCSSKTENAKDNPESNEPINDFEPPIKEEYLSDFDIDDLDDSNDENYTSSEENSKDTGNDTSEENVNDTSEENLNDTLEENINDTSEENSNDTLEENLNDDKKIFIHESTIDKKKLLDCFMSDPDKNTFIVKNLKIELNRIDLTKITGRKSPENLPKNVTPLQNSSGSSILSQWLNEPPKRMNFQLKSAKTSSELDMKYKSDDFSQSFDFEKASLTCEECNETFVARHHFLSHKLLHPSKFKCDTCGKAYIRKAGLKQHVKSHMEGYTQCKYCVFYYTPENMAIHLKRHKLNPKFKCKHCPKAFHERSSRTKHLTEAHSMNVYKHPCDLCPKEFRFRSSLKIHKDYYHSRIVTCKVCGMQQTRSEYKIHLKRHMAIVTSDESSGDKYECEMCHTRFRLWKYLKRHMIRHKTAKNSCPICKVMFSSRTLLCDHLNKVHFSESV